MEAEEYLSWKEHVQTSSGEGQETDRGSVKEPALLGPKGWAFAVERVHCTAVISSCSCRRTPVVWSPSQSHKDLLAFFFSVPCMLMGQRSIPENSPEGIQPLTKSPGSGYQGLLQS